jgi:uncharacterized protein YbjQ (UPF0145 family)
MVWLTVLGLTACVLIFAGCWIAAGRIRRYREEGETRRARAFAEMMEIAERKGKKGKD